MSDEPLTTRELDAFRSEADRFIAALDEEAYLHYAGHKDTLELESIYERYADLTKLETAQRLEGAPTELWRFACDGFLGNLTRSHQERLAKVEAGLEARVDGDTIPYRKLRGEIANEPDRARRERLQDDAATAHGRAAQPGLPRGGADRPRGRAAARRAELLRALQALRLQARRARGRLQELLDRTERQWEEAANSLLRERLQIGLSDVRTWDIPRLFRAPEWDVAYPPDRMLPALRETLRDLGIDLDSQSNVELDLEDRPAKDPRAFCAPIEIPDRVMLVLAPIGGLDDWATLFHEAGHTEHYAFTSADLSMEAKRLGDMAVTEGWAALFEHLVTEPAWLNRRLDVPRVAKLANESAVSMLYFRRRYCAKLLYEIEFFQADDPVTMRPRYAELLTEALKLPAAAESYLDDIDGSFYVTGYLRSWAFEAQMRDYLRSEFGTEWFARREAGGLLRELWSLGQGPTADELMRDVTGSGLEMASIADRIGERLAA